MSDREPTDAEYRTAQRAVARLARRVREISDNPTVRGHLSNAYPEEGVASFYLTSNYGYLNVVEAARKAGASGVIAVSLNVQGEIAVTYRASGAPASP
ncbi:hypothetical protein AB0395_34790 [Streptosporangium sp. NPDC051023]|uniref:hypothetical protein n=1 Tax=Streptosporangium sp. NPDC051023 TaxID=3155410 RepID=UPI0034500CC6